MVPGRKSQTIHPFTISFSPEWPILHSDNPFYTRIDDLQPEPSVFELDCFQLLQEVMC